LSGFHLADYFSQWQVAAIDDIESVADTVELGQAKTQSSAEAKEAEEKGPQNSSA
jgi:hypothetical protein